MTSEYPGSELRYLDEAPLRDAAQADPGRFVPHDGLLVIDEVQRVPDLFLAIKHLLPGRSETVELWPLSQGEIDQRPRVPAFSL